MKLEEARMQFIQSWGVVGSSWGIAKSMAQIHALLLTHENGLSTEDVMSTLQLSRGNVNINLRELVNWGLISKRSKLGERKEFFQAEHDVNHIARSILAERKKREFVPIFDLLKELKKTKIQGPKEEVDHFNRFINEMEEFVTLLDKMSDLMMKMNENKFFLKMVKMMS